eukprot:4104394-Prymnesium_polylepis.1
MAARVGSAAPGPVWPSKMCVRARDVGLRVSMCVSFPRLRGYGSYRPGGDTAWVKTPVNGIRVFVRPRA